jgi:5'-nucleotidase
MRILVSNDDGIYSPGLAALAGVARRFGDVRIVAPDVEQSSASHAVTAARPVRHRRVELLDGIDSFRVDGTPADCVALGAHLWGHVDLVLSGINLGVNLGNAIWHSGTLAAAKQGVLLGIRAIALSAPSPSEPGHFDDIAPWAERAIRTVLDDREPHLVNVNIPHRPRGLRWTRQAVDHYNGRVVSDADPMGRDMYWFTVVPIESPAEGSDLWAFDRGEVSLTPLRLDLTDHDALGRAGVREGMSPEPQRAQIER